MKFTQSDPRELHKNLHKIFISYIARYSITSDLSVVFAAICDK